MHRKSVVALAAGLRAGEYSCEELVRAFLARIAEHGEALNCYLTVTGERALVEAREADRRIARGDAGPLTGIPVAHKDIFCTDGVPTTCGSRILEHFVPAYDAAVVERCRAAGMVMLGKTNMDEFAMGSSNETSFFGPVRNPWDPARVPGGSSGGSAAAVAAALAPVATGTDTGGSIRQPAALCGITGLKPTYGRVSRWGMIAFASSLDQAGPFGRSAEDVALLLGTMAGFDARDSTCLERAVGEYAGRLDAPLAGLRVGLPREHFGEELDAAVGDTVHEAVRVLERAGASVRDVSLPNTQLSIPAYYVIAPAEASSNLSRYDGVRFGYRTANAETLQQMYERTRSEGFGAEVKRRVMIGTYALSAGYYDAYYLKAQKLRRLISQDFRAAFEQVDVLAGPTSPFTAFQLGEKMDDPVKMYLCDLYANAINLAGLPALSLPCGTVQGLPVGLHLMGDYLDEARLLNVAHRFQAETDWHLRAPPGYE